MSGLLLLLALAAAPLGATTLLAPTCERFMNSGLRPAAAQKSCCRLIIDSCEPRIAAAQKAYDAKLAAAERACASSALPAACVERWRPTVESALDVLTETRTRCNASQTFWCKGMGPNGDGVMPD